MLVLVAGAARGELAEEAQEYLSILRETGDVGATDGADRQPRARDRAAQAKRRAQGQPTEETQ